MEVPTSSVLVARSNLARVRNLPCHT